MDKKVQISKLILALLRKHSDKLRDSCAHGQKLIPCIFYSWLPGIIAIIPHVILIS